jgi:hypothetical protein
VLQNTEPNWSLTLRVIKGSPEKMTCVVDIMEFATGSTALEARSTSSSVSWKPLPFSTCGLLHNKNSCYFLRTNHQNGQTNQISISSCL